MRYFSGFINEFNTEDCVNRGLGSPKETSEPDVP